jgi:hypothetical protein
MTTLDPCSRFSTPFGILHTLTKIERDCSSLIAHAVHNTKCVMNGLESGDLTPDVAVEMLREAVVSLEKIAK